MATTRITEGTRNQDAADGPRWTKGRIVWLSVASIAAAASIVLGVIAFQEADLKAAQAAFESGELGVAKLEVRHFLERNPNHGRAQTLYAKILVGLRENPETALGIFEQYQASDIEEIHAWARAYLMVSQWSSAIPLLERVVEAEPENQEALHELISAWLRMRRFDKAITAAERYATLPGCEARGHVFLATIYLDQEEFEKCCQEFEAALQHDPSAENVQLPSHQFFASYAQALLAAGKPEEAEKTAERSISFTRTPEAFITLGEALQQLGNEQRARQAWREAIHEDIANPVARRNLAQLELQAGKPDDAILWMQRVAESSELTSEDAYMMERCYRALKEEAKATEWQERVAVLRKEDGIRSRLYYESTGNPHSAVSIQYFAWQFARAENWIEAEAALSALAKLPDAYESEFVTKLANAVDKKSSVDIPTLGTFQFPEIEQ